MPASHLGVDKQDMPGPPGGPFDDAKWMANILPLSNLDFTGAYVTGAGGAEITGSAKKKLAWMGKLTALINSGWGTVLWYVGHTHAQVIGDDPKKHPLPESFDTAAAEARGVAHAQHVKLCLAGLGMEGAVVMFDNENDPPLTFTPEYVAYFESFVDELQRPDRDVPAYRAGVYAKLAFADQLASTNRDLFLWEVGYFAKDPDPSAVFKHRVKGGARKLEVIREKAGISAGMVDLTGSGPVLSIRALGHQYVEVGRAILPPRLKTTDKVQWPKSLYEVRRWDFNGSLVRDPSFPAAAPRITSSPSAVFRSVFAGRDELVPPHANVEVLVGSDASDLGRDETLKPAPDAPIVAAEVWKGDAIASWVFTIGIDGEVIAFFADNNVPMRLLKQPMATAAGFARPRRLHALAAIGGEEEPYVIFIGEDHRIYLLQRDTAGDWMSPSELQDLVPHPFSKLCVAACEDGVWVGFVGWTGFLVYAFEPFGQAFTTKEGLKAPLAGTALAAIGSGKRIAQVSIDANTLQLGLSGRDESGNIVQLQLLGKDTDLVHPHSGVAIAISGEHELIAAAITDRGELGLYHLLDNGGFYALKGDRVAVPAPTDDPVATVLDGALAIWTGWMTAGGWHLNPYSDVAFSWVDNELAVFVAGVNREGPGLLRWRQSEGWMVSSTSEP